MKKLMFLLLAVEELVRLGRTNIKEFGGITERPYEAGRDG